MNLPKTVVLTICSRNYLGQALTLRSSVLKHCHNYDFYLFLADEQGDFTQNWVVPLSNEIVPDWKKMAFKYDVIEFNTCIKPFCIEFLFKKGYEQVLYIDPDIYLFDTLDSIVEKLQNNSIVLTPHRIKMMAEVGGFVNDVAISQNGIYNLGFCAIKNNEIGNSIVKWWENRLSQYCYNEAREGLAVDQKWMDFIPAYFPDDAYISHDPGLNFAVWNVNEREVSFHEGKPYVNVVGRDEKFSLKFFHFSGFSPQIPNRLDKRAESSDIKNFPNLQPLVKEYYDAEMANDFFDYRKYQYAFSTFSNGVKIYPLHRRIFRVMEKEWETKGDPFDANGFVYKKFRSNYLMSEKKLGTVSISGQTSAVVKPSSGFHSLSKIHRIMRLVLRTVGIDKYHRILRGIFGNLSKFENNSFIVKND